MRNYSDKLLAIDDLMVALNRPRLPFDALLKPKLLAEYRASIEAWEEANPEAAVRWHELRAQYIVEEELELEAKYAAVRHEDEWNYALLERLGCPGPYIETARRGFIMNASMRASHDWMRDGTQWALVLGGGHGCGKSVAAAWTAHQLLMRRFRPTWVDCAHECMQPMYGVGPEHLRWRCREAAALVLDDLGSKRQMEQAQGPWLAWLDDVIGSRANNNKRTVITTNRNRAELQAWLGSRLWDRLRVGVIHETAEPSMRKRAGG